MPESGDLGKTVSRKRVTIGGPVSRGEPAISHEDSQELTDAGLEQVEVESLGTCAGCGTVFHQAANVAGVCVCGAVLCANCATVRCAAPSCFRLLCPSCRHSWGSGFLCSEHQKARLLAVALFLILALAFIWLTRS